MTQPTPDVIEVAKDALYREAGLWDEQVGRLSDCAFQAEHSIIDLYDVVQFNDFLTGYNEVTRVFARLCTQGSLVTRDVAQTLRTVANTYEETDDSLRAQFDHH